MATVLQAASLPPVAVLPSGKTNLIAMDLGVRGDPVAGLERLIALAQGDLAPHLVAREMIALSHGAAGGKPVIGMFLGGAGLADIMLYCRNRIYPLGLPNGISHVLTAFAVVLRQVFGLRAKFLPPDPRPLSISVRKGAEITGRFALLAVTTLEKLLLSGELDGQGQGDAQVRRGGAARRILAQRFLRQSGRQPGHAHHARRACRGSRRDQHLGRFKPGDPGRRDV